MATETRTVSIELERLDMLLLATLALRESYRSERARLFVHARHMAQLSLTISEAVQNSRTTPTASEGATEWPFSAPQEAEEAGT